MRTAKRDKEKRAYKQGYNQGIKGHSQALCPYTHEEVKALWLGGWRSGRADRSSGFRNHDANGLDGVAALETFPDDMH